MSLNSLSVEANEKGLEIDGSMRVLIKRLEKHRHENGENKYGPLS